MSTGQSDDEIDDDEEMDDAPNDPSSSSTSRAKAKELSRNSKKKKAREAQMAKGREEQTTEDPNVEIPYVETLHPKPTKQPKYDKIGRNDFTYKNTVKDEETRKTHGRLKVQTKLKTNYLCVGIYLVKKVKS